MARVKDWRVVLGAWAFVLLLNPVSATAAENLKKVIMAIPSVTINMTPLWIAQEKGFFKEEGLDVEVKFISGNTITVQALLSGQIQASWGGAAAPISAIAGGGDVVIVAVPEGKMGYMLVSRQPIKNPSELNGKKFAISARGGSDEVATRLAIEIFGADPNRANMIVLGGSAQRLAGLQSGSVDAALISGPTFFGDAGKLYKILDLSETDIEYPHTTIFVSKKFASGNRDAVLGLLRGYQRGVRFFENNKEESIKIASPQLKNPPKEVLERQWQYCATHTYERIPYPTRKGFKFIIDELTKENPKVSSLKMEDVFDVSYLNDLLKDGLFTRKAMEGNGVTMMSR
jgi:NitT/TauT family transport system substrate-binding protein